MGDDPPDVHRIARAVKDAAGWRSEKPTCRHPHDRKAGYALAVHHEDSNPANCDPENLAALCQRCHMIYIGRKARYGPEDDRQLRLW